MKNYERILSVIPIGFTDVTEHISCCDGVSKKNYDGGLRFKDVAAFTILYSASSDVYDVVLKDVSSSLRDRLTANRLSYAIDHNRGAFFIAKADLTIDDLVGFLQCAFDFDE